MLQHFWKHADYKNLEDSWKVFGRLRFVRLQRVWKHADSKNLEGLWKVFGRLRL